jgi:hypothetical protein
LIDYPSVDRARPLNLVVGRFVESTDVNPKVFAFVMACLVLGGCVPERARAQAADPYPATGAACRDGDLEIAVEHTTIVEGSNGELIYTFSTRRPVTLFNPAFSWHRHPGKVTISNSTGVVVDSANVNLNCIADGPAVDSSHWVRIPSGCRIGARIVFRLAVDCYGDSKLPPGRYSVQLTLFKAYVSGPPRDNSAKSLRKINGPMDQTPLCTSNAVQIEIVKAASSENAPN